MKITTKNYFSIIEKIGDELPEVMQMPNAYILAHTNKGKNWSEYKTSKEFNRLAQLIFKKLEEFIRYGYKKELNGAGEYLTPKDIAIKLVEPCFLKADTTPLMPHSNYSIKNPDYAAYVDNGKVVVTMLYETEIHEEFDIDEILKEITLAYTEKKSGSSISAPKPPFRKARITYNHKQPEFKILKAILNWHNMTVQKSMVKSFISELKGYFETKQLNKKSIAIKEIEIIQKKLDSIYKAMGYTTKVILTEESRKLFKTALKKVTDKNQLSGLAGIKKSTMKNTNTYKDVAIEIGFIHRFLEFHNKIIYKNTFGIFIDELQAVIEKGQIRKTSPVAKDVMAIQNACIREFNTMYNAKHFVLRPATIKKLKEIIEKSENSYEDLDKEFIKSKKKSISLHGVEEQAPVRIISSTEYANLPFITLGFKDKWLAFIGDPCAGFKAAVSGKPKFGKTILCIDFANYLAKNHGKTLYVTREEFLSPTFSAKLKEKNMAHENMDISGLVPADLSKYQFVFLDSVTSMKLSTDDLKKLEKDNPGKCFIYVFQVTKNGQARGTNEFMHNVDIIIEVPERGKAIQYGRFNQGGEMDIFETGAWAEAA